MNLTYKAVDASGQRVSSVIEAPNIRDAQARLRGEGLFVTEIQETSGAAKSPTKATSRDQPIAAAKLPLKALLLFTRQLHMLLKSGSALAPALRAIGRQLDNPQHSALIDSLIVDLEEGAPFSEALKKHPTTFDSTYCAIVAAGEASAQLADMIGRVAEVLVKQRTIRNKLLGAIAYPALLMTMSSGILMVMMFFVIPRFGEMFNSLNMTLPTSTRIMLDLADLLQVYWPLVILIPLVITGGIAYLIKTPRGRQWAANTQTKIPLVGRLCSRLIQGSFLRTFGSLIECRVALLDTLELSRGLTANASFHGLFDDMESAVTEGKSMSNAMEKSKLIPPPICQAIRTGEDTGSLGQAITFAADIVEEENQTLIDSATRLIEPAVLIVMGFVVGGVAISLFMPMFDMTAAINQ